MNGNKKAAHPWAAFAVENMMYCFLSYRKTENPGEGNCRDEEFKKWFFAEHDLGFWILITGTVRIGYKFTRMQDLSRSLLTKLTRSNLGFLIHFANIIVFPVSM